MIHSNVFIIDVSKNFVLVYRAFGWLGPITNPICNHPYKSGCSIFYTCSKILMCIINQLFFFSIVFVIHLSIYNINRSNNYNMPKNREVQLQTLNFRKVYMQIIFFRNKKGGKANFQKICAKKSKYILKTQIRQSVIVI